MTNRINHLVRELSQEFKTNISLMEGASILTLSDGREVWLECPESSALFVIHSELRQSRSPSLQEMSNWLELNAALDKLKGAYISYNPDNATARLCVSLPVELVNAKIVKVVIENLTKTISEIS